MPCNMPSTGERITLIELDGNKKLREILEKIQGYNEHVLKVEALFEIQSTYSMYLLINTKNVVGACIEEHERKYLGKEGIDLLKTVLDETPLKGYIDIQKISNTALELDLELEPSAKLEKPISLNDILEDNEQSKISNKEAHVSTANIQHKQEQNELKNDASSAQDKATPVDLTRLDLATIMLYLVTRSELVKNSSNPNQLLNTARKLSSNDQEAFYRVAVEYENKDTYNIFFYKGKLCNIIHVLPNDFRVEYVQDIREENLIKLLEQDKEKITWAILYRVNCPECAEIVLGKCLEGKEETEKTVKDETKGYKEAKEESKRKSRISLFKIFRRSNYF